MVTEENHLKTPGKNYHIQGVSVSQNNDLGEIYTFQLTNNWLFNSLVGTSTTVFIHVV